MTRCCSTVPFIHADLSTNQTSRRCLLSTPLGNPLLTISDTIHLDSPHQLSVADIRRWLCFWNKNRVEVSNLVEKRMAFFFFFSYGAFFYLAANEHLSRALYFTSRPTRIPSLRRFILPRGQRGSSLFWRFLLPRGQRGSPFPGRFLLPRGQRGSRSTSISSGVFFYLAANKDLSLQGIFFYLAANKELLSWALSFTSRLTSIPSAFFYLAANEDLLSYNRFLLHLVSLKSLSHTFHPLHMPLG